MKNKEKLEEAIKREYEARKFNSDFPFDPQSFKLGAKWEAKRRYTEEDIDKQIQDFKHDLLESTSDYIKQLCSGAILGLNRLKQFKKK